MRVPELLAPAGSLFKLKVAILYGADAVYCAGKAFGLRAAAENLSFEELREGVQFAHERGRRIYQTLNVIPREDDLERLPEFIETSAQTGIDAFIVSDPGVFSLVKKYAPGTEIHISTQANITNHLTCEFWKERGASRVVLARELTLQEIRTIAKNSGIELEAFVHGAMCVSYSGRCLISNYLAGRDSNGGACAQPCRWSYALMEEKRPGVYLPVEEDERGTYLFNSKDLCLIRRLGELWNAGVCSFKVEGRVKSEFYLATVIAAYRRAIDALLRGEPFDPTLLEEVEKVSHRDYFEGFLDSAREQGEIPAFAGYIRDYEYMALVEAFDSKRGEAKIRQRGKFYRGDRLELVSPGAKPREFVAEEIRNEAGEPVESTPHADERLTIKLPFEVAPFAMLRKKMR